MVIVSGQECSRFPVNERRHILVRRKGGRVVIPYRPVLKWIVRLRRSPRAIAGGFALGTFVAFTPTFGVQFGIALLLATFLNVNRPAAFVTVWITNVVTLAPIYTFNYWVGSLFFSGPSVAEVYKVFLALTAKLVKIEIWEMLDQFRVLMGLGREIIIPLILGSCIVGSVVAVIVYMFSMLVIRYILVVRARKRKLR